MSRFHRDTFHPVRPDRASTTHVKAPAVRGRRSTKALPPWVEHPEAVEPPGPLDLRGQPPAERGASSRRVRKVRGKRA